MEPRPPGAFRVICPSSSVITRPDVTQRIMKIEPGHGTKKELSSARPNGSWSFRGSVTTVSGGVMSVQMVELSWSGMGFGSSWLTTMMAEFLG